MERGRAVIRLGVRGPAGESGFLLVSPPNEALDWDIENEIGSTSRQWMSRHQAWWIALPYLPTAREIVRRFDPPAEPAWLRFAKLHLPERVLVRLVRVLRSQLPSAGRPAGWQLAAGGWNAEERKRWS